jgi:hypothetical protein
MAEKKDIQKRYGQQQLVEHLMTNTEFEGSTPADAWH